MYGTLFQAEKIHQLCQVIREPVCLIEDKQTSRRGVLAQSALSEVSAKYQGNFNLVSAFPALYPERLGSNSFLTTHGARFPYIIGAMANGITTAKMVIAAARAGCMGFFGAGGLPPEKVLDNIIHIQSQLSSEQINWGSNLIHSPYEPMLETRVLQIYLDKIVRRISVSAYMKINLNIVLYACKGLHQDPQGNIQRLNYIFAKISRPEVAKQFLEPAPKDMLAYLLDKGELTPTEVQLARHVPLAEDITVESDSGGHTDNRPLTALFPAIEMLAREISAQHKYQRPVRVGAAGGIGTPSAAAAAFSLGAAYILTGSINQASVESGLSLPGKQLLAQADIADVAMAPAADMFELGVNVQILKRGTLFAGRAKRLFELYKSYDAVEDIPLEERTKLEKTVFKMSLNEVWQQTCEFFQQRDARQLVKAANDPKYRMALIFRWYLGLSSFWSIMGEESRIVDYQIWCGPALGAFNRWVKGSFLEPLGNRHVVQIALNLLEGAAVITRAQQLRSANVDVPPEIFNFRPTCFSHCST